MKNSPPTSIFTTFTLFELDISVFLQQPPILLDNFPSSLPVTCYCSLLTLNLSPTSLNDIIASSFHSHNGAVPIRRVRIAVHNPPNETYPGDAAVNGYANAANQFYFDHPSHANFENLRRVGRTRVALRDPSAWAIYFATYLEQ